MYSDQLTEILQIIFTVATVSKARYDSVQFRSEFLDVKDCRKKLIIVIYDFAHKLLKSNEKKVKETIIYL